MKLNLGSAETKYEGFLSVDICPPADIIADLTKPWPWEDSSVVGVLAFDIFEHLPDKIHTMNELHRVLDHLGMVHIIVPSASKGAGAFQDPTHKSYWTMNDFQYFQEGSVARLRFAKSYGITARFRIIRIYEEEVKDVFEPVTKITAVLTAVKNV